MSGAASVNIREVDISTRVASFEGVFGAIVLQAKKGRIGEPNFSSNSTAFLNSTTPDGRVEVGYDLGYFSALAYLERSNKLWWARAANTPFYAGATIFETTSLSSNAALPANTDLADPEAYTFAAEEALLIYGSSQGDWANDIAITITTIDDDPDLVEDNSFLIQVFKRGNTATPVEEHLVSRVIGQKNGRGQNMFVEDVLESSSFIRAISNPAIDGTVLPKTQATALFLADGDDGLAVTDSNMITAANLFANKAKVDVTLLMDGGYSSEAYQIALDTIAQTRQDCVAILSVPYSEQLGETAVQDIVTYRETTLNLNSSYSGLYAPHLQISDRFNDRRIWVAPDGHIAGSISLSSRNFEIWYPPAGFKRGILNVLDTRVRFDDGDLDILYNKGINPIRFFQGRGIVVWGQKTLQVRASALDRMNVRLLLIVITPAVKEFLENFLFDLNEPGVGAQIEGGLEDYFDGIVARKGVTDYDVVSDDTNNTQADIDANRRNVDIFIKPTRSTEEIPVRIVITPSSVSFGDAAGTI